MTTAPSAAYARAESASPTSTRRAQSPSPTRNPMRRGVARSWKSAWSTGSSRALDLRRPVDVEQVAPELRGRAARRARPPRRPRARTPRRRPPTSGVAVDRVAGGLAVPLEHDEALRRLAGRVEEDRNSHQLRVRPSIPGTSRRTRPRPAGRAAGPRPARRSAPSLRARSGCANAEYDARDRDLADQRRHPVPEAAVDRLLGGPERRDRLAALVHVVELRAHHRPQDAAAAVRRIRADDRDAGAVGDLPPGTVISNGKAPAPPTMSVLAGRVHPLEREVLREALDPLLVGLQPKYWPIAKTACPNSSRSAARVTRRRGARVAIRSPRGSTAGSASRRARSRGRARPAQLATRPAGGELLERERTEVRGGEVGDVERDVRIGVRSPGSAPIDQRPRCREEARPRPRARPARPA